MEAKLEFKKKIKGTQKIVPLLVGTAEEVIEGKYNNGKFYPVVEDKTLSKEFSPKIGKIYLDVSTDKQYKWDGEEYKEVNDNNVYTKNETYNKEETNNLVGNAENAIKVTYNELVTLRNNSQLVPGRFYRITDYENNSLVNFDGLTTHPFDIILLALTENKLAEEGWAAMHENIYDVTFSDGVTKKCYLYTTSGIMGNVVDVETLLGYDGIDMSSEITINEESKTAQFGEGVLESTDLTTPNLKYNYFQDENFSTWKLWYCLDNDGDRFKWTDESGNVVIREAYVACSGSQSLGYTTLTFNNQPFFRKSNKDISVDNNNYYAWEADINGRTLVIFTTDITVTSDTILYRNPGGSIFSQVNYTFNGFYQEIIVEGTNKGVIYFISTHFEYSCKLKWKELKILRDSNALIPYNKYRIVDYVTTTAQDSTATAGHRFDIITTALTNNKLSEEAAAAISSSYIYDVTFSDSITKKCYIYYNQQIGGVYVIADIDTLLTYSTSDITNIDEKNKTAVCLVPSSRLNTSSSYNYFSTVNINLWKVWYCLDNDTDRFAWADDNEEQKIYYQDKWFVRAKDNDINNLFAWCNNSNNNNSYIYTKKEELDDDFRVYNSGGSLIYNTGIQNFIGFGRGVIYRLIDDFNNDCSYDFKNIIYTFKQGFTVKYSTYGLRTKVYGRNSSDDQNIDGVQYYGWVKIAEPSSGGMNLPDKYWTTTLTLAKNIDRYVINEGVVTINSNGNIDSFSNANFNTYTFHGRSYDASLNKSDKVYYNKILSYYNTANQKFELNFIYFRDTGLSELSISYNSFGFNCYNISFKGSNTKNSFGNNNYNITFNEYNGGNVLGNSCSYISFDTQNYENYLMDNCTYNTFSYGSSRNYLEPKCSNNTFGRSSYDNHLKHECSANNISAYSSYILLGKSCSNINLNKEYMKRIIIEDFNQYIDIDSSQTTSYSNMIKNIVISKGVNNTTTVKTISHDTLNDTFTTIYKGEDTVEATVTNSNE